MKLDQGEQRGIAVRSLSLRRAWIEMPMVSDPGPNVLSRSPYGERGLKYVFVSAHSSRFSRSPYGERGLKSDRTARPGHDWPSLSLRRAWIEMILSVELQRCATVALLTESVD